MKQGVRNIPRSGGTNSELSPLKGQLIQRRQHSHTDTVYLDPESIPTAAPSRPSARNPHWSPASARFQALWSLLRESTPLSSRTGDAGVTGGSSGTGCHQQGELLVWVGTGRQAGPGTVTGSRGRCKMASNPAMACKSKGKDPIRAAGWHLGCVWTPQTPVASTCLPPPREVSYKVRICLAILAPLCPDSALLIAFSQSLETYRSVSKLWQLQQLSQLKLSESWHHSFACDETLSSFSGFSTDWESVCSFYEKLKYVFLGWKAFCFMVLQSKLQMQ